MPSEGPIRATVLYHGHVQGVGFRYTTQTIARGFAVGGFVENLPDGRVRLVVEGDRGEVDRVLRSIDDRMERYIESADRTDAATTGEFADFRIHT